LEAAPRGVLLAVVDLVDAVRYSPRRRKPQAPGREPDPYGLEADPLAFGPFCWILRNPRSLPDPIPCPGQRGLWETPASGPLL